MRVHKPSRGVIVGTAIAAAALTVGIGGASYSATGGHFILGQSNAANAPSTLKNTTGTALSLKVPASKAPLVVNSNTKVAKLNSDRLDGLDSTAFQAKMNVVTRVSAATLTPSSGPINRQARAYCLPGERAVGGGGHVEALTPDRLGEY